VSPAQAVRELALDFETAETPAGVTAVPNAAFSLATKSVGGHGAVQRSSSISSAAGDDASRVCGSGRVRRLSRSFQEPVGGPSAGSQARRGTRRCNSRDPLGASLSSLRADAPRAPAQRLGEGLAPALRMPLSDDAPAAPGLPRRRPLGMQRKMSRVSLVVDAGAGTKADSKASAVGDEGAWMAKASAPKRLARSDTVPALARLGRSTAVVPAGCDGSPVAPRSPSSKALGTSPLPMGAAATPKNLGKICMGSPDARSPLRDLSALDDAFGPFESWTDALSSPVTQGEPTPTALFEVFRTAEDLTTIFSSFAQLFKEALKHSSTCPAPHAPVKRPWRFPYEPIRVLLGGHWKAKMLWEKMDARCSREEYSTVPCSGGRLAGQRVVVVGAGPCGLRAAIELRLLGAQVTVLERRDKFNRLNRLHLWSWCGEDLKALGARCLEPPPADFGSDPDLLNAGIGEIQILLLKTSLLLGVQVLVNTSYSGVRWAGVEAGGWVVRCERKIQAVTSPSAGSARNASSSSSSAHLPGVAVVVGAGGLASSFGRSAGMETVEVSSLRAEDAIGLVCNFTPSTSSTSGGDKSLRCFSLARQFYDGMFQRLKAETGADLENIVYTRSKASHYFVMTPTRRCLIEAGVLRDPTAKPMLHASNVDRVALDRLVRRIVAFRFREGQETLAEAYSSAVGEATELQYADSGPQLFDFSKMFRAAEGLNFLSPPASAGKAAEDYQLLMALAGDALVEPFWPEGLGIVRGFFGVLDVAYATARWAAGIPLPVVRSEFAAAYGQLKTLGAASRGRVLRDDESKYALAPSTRYRGVSSVVDALDIVY